MNTRLPFVSQILVLCFLSLLAAIPVAFIVFLAHPDLNGESEKALREETARLSSRITGYRKDVESLGVKASIGQDIRADFLEGKATEETLVKTNESIALLQLQLSDARESYAEEAGNYFAVVDQYRSGQRNQAVGESLQELTLRSGEVFTDVAIQGVDSSGLTIRYPEGIKKIPYLQLPLEIQKRFEFADSEATESVRAELERQKQES